MANPNSRLVGMALTLIAAVAFSAKALFAKAAYAYGVDTVTLLTVRMGLALPCFAAIALWSVRARHLAPLSAREGVSIAALGVLGYYAASYLDFLGLRFIPAGLERLILFLYPTFVLILSMLFVGKKPAKRELVALALSYLGLVLSMSVFWAGRRADFLLGAGFVLLSALAFAVYLLGSGTLVRKAGALRFSAYAMLAATVPQLLQFVWTHPLSALRLPAEVYWLGVLLALVSTVLPILMFAEGLRRIGANQAAILGAAGPVAVLAYGALWLHEPFGIMQALGSACVLAGVLLLTFRHGQAA